MNRRIKLEKMKNFKLRMIYGVCGALAFILLLSSMLIFPINPSVDISIEVDKSMYSTIFEKSTAQSKSTNPAKNQGSFDVSSTLELQLTDESTSLILDPDVPLSNNIESATASDNNNMMIDKYHIIWGDTLTEIANTYNYTVEELAQFNNISNPNLIYAGNDISFPTSTYTD